MSSTTNTLRALTLTGLMLAGSFATAAPAHAADPVADPNTALTQCGNINSAVVLDLSNSFTPAEVEQEKSAVIDYINSISAAPGAKVTVFTFAFDAPVNYQGTRTEAGQNYPVGQETPIAANAPSQSFDVSTEAGKSAAIAWVNGVTKGGENQPRGDMSAETAAQVNFQTLGTNWEAALKAVQDYQAQHGMKFDNVLLSTDGAPTALLDDSGQAVYSSDLADTPAGDFNESTFSSQRAFNEAKQVANQLEASGTKVIPVMVKDPAINTLDGFGTDQDAILKVGASLAKAANPVEGVDYFTGNMDELGVKLYNAATSTCPTDLKINKDASQATVNYDGTISFPLTVLNDGDWDEPKASVTDEGVIFTNKATGEKVTVKDVTITDTSAGTATGADWNIGLLKAGDTATATATVKVPEQVASWFDADISAVNSALVTGHRDPYNPNTPHQSNTTVGEDTDNWDDSTVKVTPPATPVSDVKIEKHLLTPKTDLAPGGGIEWEINGLNDSNTDDPKVVANDILSDADTAKIKAGSLKVEVIEGDGSYDAATNTYTAANGLKAGESFKLKVTATLADDANLKDGLTNKATISGKYDPFDPSGQCEPNNGAITADTDNCDVSVTKIDSAVKIYKEQVTDKLTAGEQGTWKITVGATGADAATNVFLADMPLAGIDADTAQFATASQGEIVKGSVLIEKGIATADQVEADKNYWFIGTLEAGKTASVEVTARVSTGATTVENSAAVDSTWDHYEGGTKDNNSLDEDDDNWDKVTGEVGKPAAPVTPAPSDPVTPAVVVPPADPSTPATPAAENPSAPAQQNPVVEQPAAEQIPTVKGHNAATGGEQTVMGMSLPVAIAVGAGVLLLVAAGGTLWANSRRAGKNS